MRIRTTQALADYTHWVSIAVASRKAGSHSTGDGYRPSSMPRAANRMVILGCTGQEDEEMTTVEVPGEDGLVISTDVARLDVDRICAWLAASYWANDRDRAAVERSIANSLCYGVYLPSGAQVALARVTTDLASFAWICDVVVDDNWRGKGIGTWLMRTVVEHLRREGVPRIVLTTRDAHGLYARVGFAPLRVPATWMEIDVRPNRPDPDQVHPAVAEH